MTTGHSLLRPTLAVAVASVLWGLYWVPVRGLQSAGFDAVQAALLLNLAALVLILPLLVRHRGLERSAIPAGLLIGAAMALYSLALGLTTVVNAVLMFYLTPVWSTLIGVCFRGERLRLRRLAALGLSFAGIWLILGKDGGLPLPGNAGDIAALAAGFLWSFGSFSIFESSRAGAVAVSFWSLLSGTVMLIAAFAVIDAGVLPAPTADLAFPVIIGGLMVVALMFLTIWGARFLPPTRVGLLLMGEIVVGVVSAALYAGEPVGLRELAGALAIILAASLEVLSPSGEEKTGKISAV